MATHSPDLARQWFWALVFLGLLALGLAATWVLRDTEVVDPTIEQEEWLEWRTRPR